MAQSSSNADNLKRFDENSLEMKVREVLGAGGFGQVVKARHHQWRCDVAVKIIICDDVSRAVDEAELMLHAECPYVMKVMGLFKGRLNNRPNIHMGLVMELMENGSLDALQEKLKQMPPWPLVFRLAHQVSLGMDYLHSLRPALIHKDLKPGNVLLDSSLNVKITDFGNAKFENNETVVGLENVMSAFFAPPEAISPSQFYTADCAYDVYSYALLVWTILNPGHNKGVNDSSIPRPSLEDVNRLEAPGLEELVELMVCCWAKNRKLRPRFTECTNVTEGLYEEYKRGINSAVRQVQCKLDGPDNSQRESPFNNSLPSVPPGSTNRKDFLKHFSYLTLNTNTAYRYLSLLENSRDVATGRTCLPVPDHPDRFDVWQQVLCTEGLTGPSYWEVERNGMVHIAVTYGGISRKGDGDDCRLGYNDKSWSLFCNDNSYSVTHNSNVTVLPVRPSGSNRVAVCLDCSSGTLSFYEVCSDSLTHLYTFHNTFSEPLYAGFGLPSSRSNSSSVLLCEQR